MKPRVAAPGGRCGAAAAADEAAAHARTDAPLTPLAASPKAAVRACALLAALLLGANTLLRLLLLLLLLPRGAAGCCCAAARAPHARARPLSSATAALAAALLLAAGCAPAGAQAPPPPYGSVPLTYTLNDPLTTTNNSNFLISLGVSGTSSPVFSLNASTSPATRLMSTASSFLANGSTCGGFTLSWGLALRPSPLSTDTSLGGGFTLSLVDARDVPATPTSLSMQPSSGVSVPVARSLALVVDLYNDGGAGIGHAVVSTTASAVTTLASHMQTGAAGVALLQALTFTGAAVTHTVDIYGGLLTWRAGANVLFANVPVSASQLPPTFVVYWAATLGTTASKANQIVYGPVRIGCAPPPPSITTPPYVLFTDALASSANWKLANFAGTAAAVSSGAIKLASNTTMGQQGNIASVSSSTFSASSSCPASGGGFSLKAQVALGTAGASNVTDRTYADGLTIGLYDASAFAALTPAGGYTTPSSGPASGVTFQAVPGVVAAVDPYNNDAANGAGYGFYGTALVQTFASTGVAPVVLASNARLQPANTAVPLLTPLLTGAAVLHEIDVYNSLLTWRAAGAVLLLLRVNVSAALPGSFVVAVGANTGGAVMNVVLSSLSLGCPSYPSPPPNYAVTTLAGGGGITTAYAEGTGTAALFSPSIWGLARCSVKRRNEVSAWNALSASVHPSTPASLARTRRCLGSFNIVSTTTSNASFLRANVSWNSARQVIWWTCSHVAPARTVPPCGGWAPCCAAVWRREETATCWCSRGVSFCGGVYLVVLYESLHRESLHANATSVLLGRIPAGSCAVRGHARCVCRRPLATRRQDDCREPSKRA
jgi:hypothetical protein